MTDITPLFPIVTSAEIPGGILGVSSNPENVVQSGTMVQPKKVETVGGMQVGATTLVQGFGNDIFRISPQGIQLGGANFVDAPFSVDMQGNLKANVGTFGGTLSAPSGHIGGFTIGSTSLSAGSGADRIELSTADGIHLGSTLFEDAPFSVDLEGALKSTSGVIGGFNIRDGYLYGGIIKTSATPETGGVIMDATGLRGYDGVLGQTFNLPTDGSAPTFSFGSIRESVFEIGSSSVIRTSDNVGDGTANSAGILINENGIYGIAANQTPATANVRILVDGSAVFNASIRGGQTDYATGDGYFLGLSAGEYKLSIGSDTNYLRWDGDNLILKGSFDVGATGLINNGVYTVANLPTSPTVVGFNVPSAYE